MTQDLLLTVPQAAALAGVSEQAIRAGIYDRRIKAVRAGPRAWIIRKSELDRYILGRLERMDRR